ncbi:hypothetical protein ACFL5V_06220 [Fibrobacterota bacterium]
MTIEKPEIIKQADDKLLKYFWPPIQRHLETIDLPYSPDNTPEFHSKHTNELRRKFFVILFDFSNRAICKIGLECGTTGWMISGDTFISLHKDTSPDIIFEILGNSRLVGCPPTLEVHKEEIENYFQINFTGGKGASWFLHDENYALEKFKQAIDVNISLHDFVVDGLNDVSDAEVFLSKVYEIYEAY